MQNSQKDVKEKVKELGRYIKQLREAHGYSFSKLSQLSGLSMGLINQLENGKARSFPKFATLTALAKALGVSEYKLQEMAGYLPEQTKDKLVKTSGAFLAEPRGEKSDWTLYFKSNLSELGLKQKYIDEIIQYIKTVKIKQEIEEGNHPELRSQIL